MFHNKRNCCTKILILTVVFLIFLFPISCTKIPGSENNTGEDLSGGGNVSGRGNIPQTQDTPAPHEDGNGNISGQDSDFLSALHPYDFQGYTLTVAALYPENVVPTDETGIINKALYYRNKNVEEKYNVKITTMKVDAAKAQSELQTAALSGTKYADLLYMPMKNLGNFGSRELLLNMYSLPFLEFDSPYIDSKACEELSVKNNLYALYGSAALQEKFQWAVFFNKKMIADYSLESPYTLARDGNWTWDKYLEYSSKVLYDLNGKKARIKDRIGHGTLYNSTDYIDAVFASFGKSFFSKDENGYPYMDYSGDKMPPYIDTVSKVCRAGGSRIAEADPGEAVISKFASGKMLFLPYRVSMLGALPENFDFGIVPMPKLTAEQKDYYSWVDSGVCGFAVPAGNDNTERTGVLLNAIYAYSYQDMQDALLQSYINYSLRDNSSAVMLKKVFDSPKYDMAYAYGGGMHEFAAASYDILYSVINKNLNFKTLYNQNTTPFSNFVKEKFGS